MSRLHAPIMSEGKKLTGDEEEHIRSLIGRSLETLNSKMAEYSKKEYCAFVWNFLLAYAVELSAFLGVQTS